MSNRIRHGEDTLQAECLPSSHIKILCIYIYHNVLKIWGIIYCLNRIEYAVTMSALATRIVYQTYKLLQIHVDFDIFRPLLLFA